MAKIIDFDYGEPHAAYRLAVLKYDNDININRVLISSYKLDFEKYLPRKN